MSYRCNVVSPFLNIVRYWRHCYETVLVQKDPRNESVAQRGFFDKGKARGVEIICIRCCRCGAAELVFCQISLWC